MADTSVLPPATASVRIADAPVERPIAVTFQTAKRISGLGLTTLWQLAKDKRIEVVHVGRRSLILYQSLERLLTPASEACSAPEPRRRRGRPPKVRPSDGASIDCGATGLSSHVEFTGAARPTSRQRRKNDGGTAVGQRVSHADPR